MLLVTAQLQAASRLSNNWLVNYEGIVPYGAMPSFLFGKICIFEVR